MTAAAAGDKSDLTFRGGLFTGDERRIQMYVYQVVGGPVACLQAARRSTSSGLLMSFFHGGVQMVGRCRG